MPSPCAGRGAIRVLQSPELLLPGFSLGILRTHSQGERPHQQRITHEWSEHDDNECAGSPHKQEQGNDDRPETSCCQRTVYGDGLTRRHYVPQLHGRYDSYRF